MRPSSVFALIFILIIAVAPAIAQQTSLLRSGPMVGYSEMTEVMVWVQTTEDADVQIRYAPEGTSRFTEGPTVPSVATSAHVARIVLTELMPGTRYTYQLFINGERQKISHPLRFQTQTLWHWRTDPPAFTVAIGSCLYINETAVDRPGKPYGSEYEILDTILAAQPDAMIWLGDNTYYREVDWHTVSGLRHRWTHTRSVREMQPLLGSVHHYFLWDDHDYGPNDADRSYRLRDAALENHILFTANHDYGTREVPGAFSRFEWADVEFIMLDDRFHRSPNATPDDDPSKTMWGAGQLQWLKDVLLSSTAPFKLVINGNQVLNPLVQHEGLARFRKEYDDLLAFIRTNAIPGVVFLSGDRHMSELIRITDTSFYPLYDFTSSSLTAGLSSPRGPEVDNPYRVPGTLVNDRHNFGLLTFSGPRTDRVLTMECRDVTGKSRWTFSVKAKELRKR